MNNSHKFLFNYFITKKNISIKEEYISRIKYEDKKSILQKYYFEIKNFINTNKLSNSDLKKIDKFEILKKISELYETELLKKNNIDYFFKIFIQFRDDIFNNKKNIDFFINISEDYIQNSDDIYNEKLYFINPITSKNSHLFLNDTLLDIYEDENFEDIKKTLEILMKGDIINLTLPSIGSLDDYKDYIYFLINNKSIDENILSDLPINNIKIYDKINQYLLNIPNDNMESLVKNTINNINLKLEDIYKKNDKINSQLIIPYDIDKKTNEINYIEKNELLTKIKKYNDLIEHNNKLILFIFDKVFKVDSIEGKKNLEKKNFKNVLASYNFYIINILSNIISNYINEINSFLKNILDSKESRFTNLNIKNAFEFTRLLKISSLKFKYILLNNFYQLFLPSKIVSGNYGMKLDKNNCFIPESVFLNSNEEIYKNYFFLDFENEILNKERIFNFITNIKKKNDIYNPNNILEFGGDIFTKKIMSKSINILLDYYKLLEKTDKFNLFIIEKLIEYFKENNIPYELISDIENYKSIMLDSILNNSTLNDIEKKLLRLFEDNIEKSTKYYLILYKIKKEMNFSKKNNMNHLISLKEISILSFKTYFSKAKSIILFCEETIVNNKLKNSILKKFSLIKKKYEDIISKEIKINYKISNY